MKPWATIFHWFSLVLYLITACLMGILFFPVVRRGAAMLAGGSLNLIGMAVLLISLSMLAFLIFAIGWYKSKPTLGKLAAAGLWLTGNLVAFYLVPSQVYLVPFYLFVRFHASFLWLLYQINWLSLLMILSTLSTAVSLFLQVGQSKPIH